MEKNEKGKVFGQMYFEEEEVLVTTIKEGEIEGLCKICLKHKPVTLLESAKRSDELLANSSVVASTEMNFRLIQEKLLEWDVSKPDGTKVDFTNIDELKRVHKKVLLKVIQVIRGDCGTPLEDAIVAQDALKNS